jgi:hypothetical protein
MKFPVKDTMYLSITPLGGKHIERACRHHIEDGPRPGWFTHLRAVNVNRSEIAEQRKLPFYFIFISGSTTTRKVIMQAAALKSWDVLPSFQM